MIAALNATAALNAANVKTKKTMTRRPKIDNLVKWQSQLAVARLKTSQHHEAIRVLGRKMTLLRVQMLFPDSDVLGFCDRCGNVVMRTRHGKDVHALVTPKQSLVLFAVLGGMKPCARPSCIIREGMRP